MTMLITPTSVVPSRRFVHGADLRVTVLATAAETDGRFDLTDATMTAGAMTPLHLHQQYDERLWVVSGELTVYAGDDKVTLRSGDYYWIPTNVPHAIHAGAEDTRALNISSPAGFAELVARSGTPAHLAGPETELDVDLFMAVTTELGDLVLGPPGTLPPPRRQGADRQGAGALGADGRRSSGRR